MRELREAASGHVADESIKIIMNETKKIKTTPINDEARLGNAFFA